MKGGVLVGGVDGPAARAGHPTRRIVLAVNGQPVESVNQFKGLVDKAPSGKPLAFLIQRGEARLYVPVMAG